MNVDSDNDREKNERKMLWSGHVWEFSKGVRVVVMGLPHVLLPRVAGSSGLPIILGQKTLRGTKVKVRMP